MLRAMSGVDQDIPVPPGSVATESPGASAYDIEGDLKEKMDRDASLREVDAQACGHVEPVAGAGEVEGF